MLTDSERLRALWNQKATMSQTAFGKRFGIGTHGMVSQYLSGRAALNLTAAVKFARGLGVSLSDISPSLAREAMEAAAISGDNFTPVEPARGRTVPLLGMVQAGLPISPGDLDFSERVVTEVPGDNVFALRIEGESMMPEFKPGDIVFVDPDVSPIPGDVVVARVGDEDEATIKRYAARGYDEFGNEAFDLIPTNPLFPVLHSSDRKTFICGVVVEHRSFRKCRR